VLFGAVVKNPEMMAASEVKIFYYISPQLTTMEQLLKDMDKMAVEKIHDLISKGVVKEQNFALTFALIERIGL